MEAELSEVFWDCNDVSTLGVVIGDNVDFEVGVDEVFDVDGFCGWSTDGIRSITWREDELRSSDIVLLLVDETGLGWNEYLFWVPTDDCGVSNDPILVRLKSEESIFLPESEIITNTHHLINSFNITMIVSTVLMVQYSTVQYSIV